MKLRSYKLFTRRCLTALLLLFALGALATPQTTPEQSTDPLPLQELRTFTSVFEHIRRNYVEDIDDKTLLENAIRGMLEGLDPHSSYLDSASFNDLQMNTTGEFGGLGLEVGMENGFVRVISPIDDTPAQRAGIESGDIIIKLDDQTVKGLSLSEAVKLMRGPRGSAVTLTIVREGTRRPFDVVVKRDVIKVLSVKSQLLEPGYGYVRIAQFQSNTGKETNQAIQSLLPRGGRLKGLIIDLRNNPGGILQASVSVADSFLERGMIVSTQGRLPSSHVNFRAKPGDVSHGTPLVVLINGGSASASEIVAGALQDHQRAVIMGTESFGKGSVQTVVPIAEDKAIKLTTALYFTPNGRSIQAKGITPDIVVEPAKIERISRAGGLTEADLSGHLQNAGEGKKAGSKTNKRNASNDLQINDNQLHEALSLLKGLNIMSKNSASSTQLATAKQAKTTAAH